MNKELIDRVWKYYLPKEFKEAVKKEWQTANDEERFPHDAFLRGCYSTMVLLFGYHNLTSDAEGEDEMLCVSRKEVIRNFKEQVAWKNHHQSSQHDRDIAMGWCNALQFLFGSKCLPYEEQSKQKDCDNPLADKEGCKGRNDGKCAFDKACYFEPLNPQEPKLKSVSEISEEISDRVAKAIKVEFDKIEPNPSESKFKVGDRVIDNENGRKGVVIKCYPNCYVVKMDDMKFPISYTEEALNTYTKPTTKPFKAGDKVRYKEVFTVEDVEKDGIALVDSDFLVDPEDLELYEEPEETDKHFDNILKDSFSKERRLNIAAMITQGIMANPNPQMVEMDAHRVAGLAILMADTLIAECEKGGSHGED